MLNFLHAEIRGLTKCYYKNQHCIIMIQSMNYKHFDVRNHFQEKKNRNLITCFNNKIYISFIQYTIILCSVFILQHIEHAIID